MATTSGPQISLVVCTRNRAPQLQRALSSLCALEFSDPWELLVVDNGSTDNTTQVLADFHAEERLPLRVISEPRAGLSRARNRGVANAKGSIIAFTDDDCYPASNYLEAIKRCFSENDVGFCGGRVLLHDPTDQAVTTVQVQTRVDIPARSFLRPGVIIGANMAVRRDLLLEVDGFDERLGPGTPLKAAEDTDLLNRLCMAGYTGLYNPCIVVSHHHGRKTLQEVHRLENGYAFGQGALMLKHCARRATRRLFMRHWYWRCRGFRAARIALELAGGARFFLSHGPTPNRLWDHSHCGLSRMLAEIERGAREGVRSTT